MTTIGEAVYADAQERLRIDINARSEEHGWAIFDCDGSANAPYQLCKIDEADTFHDDDEVWAQVWHAAEENPIGLEAEALGWLKSNSPEEYRYIAAGFPRGCLRLSCAD